jgi:imidazole glycerol-phosphate synthase subunit HisH
MIALVDYRAGNLRSVQNALETLGVGSAVATTPAELARAGAIVFPGVGAAAPAMASLRAQGMDQALVEAIERGTPFLGICLGLQLLFDRSAEDGAACLGVLEGTVERLPTREKLPHVGWNTIDGVMSHPVLAGLDGEAMYFTHSYVVAPKDRSVVAAHTTHGVSFVSAIAAGSMVAVQFHPERSGHAGLRLLENFLQYAHVAQANHSLS